MYKLLQFNLNVVYWTNIQKKKLYKNYFLIIKIYDLNGKSDIFIIISFRGFIFVIFLRLHVLFDF